MSRQVWTRTSGFALVAALSAAVAPQAVAQQVSTTGSGFDATGSTFGAPTRDISIDVTGQATYDSNISRSSRAGISARGIEKEDMRLTPAVEANITLPTPVAVLSLSGTVGYDFFVRNTQLNRERIDLLAGAATKLSICDVGAQAGYSRAQSDLIDLSIVPGDPETSTVNVAQRVRVGGSVTCGSGSIRPTAFVDYRTVDNSAVRRRISNVDSLTYGGGVSYTSPSFGVLTAFVSRSNFDFPNRDGPVAALQSFDLTSYGLRLDRRLGGRLQVHGQVSYVDVGGVGSFNDRFDGLNWDASAALRIGERARLSLAAARQIDASAAFNLRTAQVSRYSAQLDYAVSPLVRAAITTSLMNRDFDVDPALAPIVVLDDDRVFEIVGRLTHNYGRRMSFNFSVGYSERSADVEIYNFDAVRAMVGATLRL